MTKQNSKKTFINVIASLIVSILAYLIFIYMNSSIAEMFIPVIFLLVLIYLEISRK